VGRITVLTKLACVLAASRRSKISPIFKTAGENARFGLSASGSWTDLDGDVNDSGGDSEMLMLAAYGTWFKDTWYSELGLGIGQSTRVSASDIP
jgi:hypothetical protein